MSADIEKMAVFDSRIVQSRPRYAVEKGALSLTNAPFNAISATASQHTYNIYVPSENVFVDRAIEWTSTVTMSSVLTTPSPTNYKVGYPLVVPGVDFSLCAFPLNSLCSTTTATINDTTSVINSQDVLKEILRLTDYKKNRLQRTCPTMLDKYQQYDDAYGMPNCPLNGYGTAMDYDGVQNGAWGQIVFTDSGGQPLVNGSYYIAGVLQAGAPSTTGLGSYQCINGLPSLATSATNPDQGTSYTIFYKWTSTEKVVLSPFTFSDVHEWDTGLFGINNIQLIMNLQSPARIIRYTGMRWQTGVPQYVVSTGSNPQSSASLGSTQFAATNPFFQSVVNVQFLTPSLDVPLPPKSVVPYMEFPRYITNGSQTILPAAPGQVQSQTITLPQIPDLLIIYAKAVLPSDSTGGVNNTNVGDFYLPLASRAYGNVANPISVNFDNFSGLLSSHTTEELYGMSVKNGLDMDWLSWAGSAYSGQNFASTRVTNAGGTSTGGGSFGSYLAGSNPPSAAAGAQLVPLTGSILVLKPSQDITLQTGQAPSLVGNFTLQLNLQFYNNTGQTVTPQLFVITANSGFFESIRGSSRIIKGVLSEQDIIGAPLAPTATRQELCRYVGGSGLLGSLGNILSKVKGPALELLKEAGMAAGKELLHHGTAFAKKKLGLGMSGGDASGGAMSGGRTRKGLDARLM